MGLKLEKLKRIENHDLIRFVQTMPCIACGNIGGDAHHITSVGAGGGDTYDNLISLCRAHHQEFHKIGVGQMIINYPSVKTWLKSAKREDVLAKILR